MMTTFSLRPMLPTEAPFAYQVYASTRMEEFSLTGWSFEQLDAFLRMQFDIRARQYHENYPNAVTEVIFDNETPAGTMTTVETSNAIILVDIALLPEFRQLGIGALILRQLQKKSKKITLHVLRQNPAARLYARLGFITVSEDSMYQQMEWTPQ